MGYVFGVLASSDEPWSVGDIGAGVADTDIALIVLGSKEYRVSVATFSLSHLACFFC